MNNETASAQVMTVIVLRLLLNRTFPQREIHAKNLATVSLHKTLLLLLRNHHAIS